MFERIKGLFGKKKADQQAEIDRRLRACTEIQIKPGVLDKGIEKELKETLGKFSRVDIFCEQDEGEKLFAVKNQFKDLADYEQAEQSYEEDLRKVLEKLGETDIFGDRDYVKITPGDKPGTVNVSAFTETAEDRTNAQIEEMERADLFEEWWAVKGSELTREFLEWREGRERGSN